MIRTINNVVRSLLFQARLPLEYWVEALLTVAYLLNILTSTSINNDTPYTKLFNKPPSYTHLRTFGCLCYPYTFPPHKLAPRTTPSIILGYPYNHRGYRCLDVNTNKIIISRHVTFDETVFSFGSMTLTKPPSYQFLDDNLDTSPIALRLLITPTSPQQTPPQTTPQQLHNQHLQLLYQRHHHKQHRHHQPPHHHHHHPPRNTRWSHALKSILTGNKLCVTNIKLSLTITPGKADSSLFIFHKRPDTAYLLLYVDDIILTASFTSLLQCIISLLYVEFAMIDLGPLNYFLGISATRTTSGIFLSQMKYDTKILEQAHMLNCNPCKTPIDTEKKLGPEGSSVTDPTLYRSLAGSLQYLTFTLPDLSYLFRSTTSQLIAYSDADWDTLSHSSVEAEYRKVANAVAETSWIRNLLRELHTPLFTATLVYYDNACAVYMSANPVQHRCTKHIEVDIHFVRDKVAAGHVRVLHVIFDFSTQISLQK
nr:retrotransposon protein, putative, unclassified [Tanacetum cinerariifolium]